MKLQFFVSASVCVMVAWAGPALARDLSRPPALKEGRITSEDYPAAALRAEIEGEMRALITIGADGRISACRTFKSSGFAMLDAHSCALMTARFVFDPALDAKGRPIEAQAIQPVSWVLDFDTLAPEAGDHIEAPPASRF